jgi:AcrR family transcriptional regulator
VTEDQTEDPMSDAERIAAAAVRLAGERGWRSLGLGDIALEAGAPLAALAGCYGSKPEILDGFERMIDRAMLTEAVAGETDERPRDRLFDVIMERFEALAPYRDGVRRIARELPFDPPSAIVLAAALPRSAAWMLIGAGIRVDGPLMPLKVTALGALYLDVFGTWLKDESQDLGRTMAALDKRLDRAAAIFGAGFSRARGAPSGPGTAASPDAPVPEGPPEPEEPQVS